MLAARNELKEQIEMQKQAMTLTDAAAERIKHLMSSREKPALGLKVGIRTGGCSGMAYTMEFASEKDKFDEIIEDKGVTVIIDGKALMFLIGTEMDYVEEKLQSGFVFNNPNASSTGQLVLWFVISSSLETPRLRRIWLPIPNSRSLMGIAPLATP